MIQRIQTLFLLLAAALIISMFNFPLAYFMTESGEVHVLKITGIFSWDGTQQMNTLPLLILFGLSGTLLLVDIFLYKRRVLQMRVAVYVILILLGGTGLMAYYIWLGQKELQADWTLKVAFVFPVVSAVLTFLAFRNIRKDEALVRAYERIR
ncbi:MAG TPA: DUF4293 family protein [Bacteroidetes bacterium]|nr:DUF4293 family protein [Bacteroidota bacterium]